jgi:hypothetical protein
MIRAFEIAADVIMGAILGIFVYTVISGNWKALHGPVVLVPVLALCILLALFRRPNGSLARRPEQR